MQVRIVAVVVFLLTLVPSAAFAMPSRILSLVPAPSFDAPLLLVLQWPICAIGACIASRLVARIFVSLLSFKTI